MVWQIKQRKQLTHVLLKDGRTLVSESSPKEIIEYIDTHSHILIEWEWHSKWDIISCVPVKVDNVETFILSQNKEMQAKLREKQARWKKTRGSEMTYSYAVNYVEEHKTK